MRIFVDSGIKIWHLWTGDEIVEPILHTFADFSEKDRHLQSSLRFLHEDILSSSCFWNAWYWNHDWDEYGVPPSYAI